MSIYFNARTYSELVLYLVLESIRAVDCNICNGHMLTASEASLIALCTRLGMIIGITNMLKCCEQARVTLKFKVGSNMPIKYF